jgi:hypothetical protein
VGSRHTLGDGVSEASVDRLPVPRHRLDGRPASSRGIRPRRAPILRSGEPRQWRAQSRQRLEGTRRFRQRAMQEAMDEAAYPVPLSRDPCWAAGRQSIRAQAVGWLPF